MAKKSKGNRVQVILECTEQKESGVPGMSRYITTKNRKNTPERLELKKYNPATNVLQTVKAPGVHHTILRDVVCFDKKRLWVCSHAGLFIVDEENKEVIIERWKEFFDK